MPAANPGSGAKVLAVASTIALAASYQCDPSRVTRRTLPDSPAEGGLSVTPLCLGKDISGVVGHISWIYGPSPMHMIGDETRPRTMYFSWTEDTTWGASEEGNDGRIHITKVQVDELAGSSPPSLTTRTFDGFMRASGIAMTETGIVGTLCAKHLPPWIRSFIADLNTRRVEQGKEPNIQDSAAPLLLAVCSVDTATMEQHGQPWRIGKYWDLQESGPTRGYWGNYPVASWAELDGNGYGWLTYSPSRRTWTAWYGATTGTHSGYAMHTYFDDAQVIDTSGWTHPSGGVESREEANGYPWNDHYRSGTGDHQRGSATRYHPLNEDIYHMKHWDNTDVYLQQYGLSDRQGKFFHDTGIPHKEGRVYVVNPKNESEAVDSEGAMRPCGNSMITGFVTEHGSICAKFDRAGDFTTWKVMNASLPEKIEANYHATNRWVRVATLGSKESEARCDRFLFGYLTEGFRRWLVEVNGECEMLTTPMDVTDVTTWPLYQEWTTTAEGAVAWVTAWQKKEDGTPIFNQWGVKESTTDGASTGGVRVYGGHSWPNGAAVGSKQEAQLTMYWPKAMQTAVAPTAAPGPAPTPAPTAAPTAAPTPAPTTAPTKAPTQAPTPAPTDPPTPAPTTAPTASPTPAPTQSPTSAPTPAPTLAPTTAPNTAMVMNLKIEPVDVDTLEDKKHKKVKKEVGEALQSSIQEHLGTQVESFMMYEADGSDGAALAVEIVLKLSEEQVKDGTTPDAFVRALTSADSEVAELLTDEISSQLSPIISSMASGKDKKKKGKEGKDGKGSPEAAPAAGGELSVTVVGARVDPDAASKMDLRATELAADGDAVDLKDSAFGQFAFPVTAATVSSLVGIMMQ